MTKDLAADLAADLGPEAIEAIQRAKSAFLGAQSERCSYLRVAFEQRPESGELALAANFTLRPKREWFQVDASIKLSDLESDDPRPAVRRAFADLADGVAMVNIAQHFRPMGGDIAAE
jgi:hypothetical protein